jgi:hypothetical protein
MTAQLVTDALDARFGAHERGGESRRHAVVHGTVTERQTANLRMGRRDKWPRPIAGPLSLI